MISLLPVLFFFLQTDIVSDLGDGVAVLSMLYLCKVISLLMVASIGKLHWKVLKEAIDKHIETVEDPAAYDVFVADKKAFEAMIDIITAFVSCGGTDAARFCETFKQVVDTKYINRKANGYIIFVYMLVLYTMHLQLYVCILYINIYICIYLSSHTCKWLMLLDMYITDIHTHLF